MIITKSRVAMSLFYIIFGGIFVLLGFWQIERGQEKQSIVDNYNIAQMQSSVAYSRDSKTWDYVYLKGYIDQSRLILIDNSLVDGMLGFKVIAPFITNTGTILMTDFGWIQQTKNRSILPEIKLPIGEISISGILENPEEGLILGEQVISGNWPKVSQSRALETIAKEFSENLEPFLLVANFQDKSNLRYVPPVVTNMPPVKHFGYAGQWFAMFIALTIMYIYSWRKFGNE